MVKQQPQPRVPHLQDSLTVAKVGLARKRDRSCQFTPESGFTLLELMIVMIIIGILAAIAVPAYLQSVKKAREATLKEDLYTMRRAIDSYTFDKQKAPQSLEDVVQSGYLKAIPVDPITHRSDSWMPVQEDTLMSIDQTASGIDDVHSGSQQLSSEGTTYNTW